MSAKFATASVNGMLLLRQVLLADRPPLTLDDLNWQDHSCYNYSITLQQAANVTILANATAEVALPSSRRGG